MAVGLGDCLVGRSHECDYPAFVGELPVCTSTKLEKGLTSRQIDDRVQEIVRQGLSVYAVDTELLRALKPDLILTQSQCAVCAVTPADLVDALDDWTGTAPQLLSLAPDALSDVWGDFGRVGDVANMRSEADAAVEGLQARLHALSEQSVGRGVRPTVAAIEWIEPLMAAGNWVPELVELAGGRPLFASAGQHSPWLDWADLFAADPDYIIAMPCGYQLPQTLADLDPLVKREGWADLSAVRAGRVFAADGHHYFNRPGPRLVESAEIIAGIIGTAESSHVVRGREWVSI